VISIKNIRTNALAVLKDIVADLNDRAQYEVTIDSRNAFVENCSVLVDRGVSTTNYDSFEILTQEFDL